MSNLWQKLIIKLGQCLVEISKIVCSLRLVRFYCSGYTFLVYKLFTKYFSNKHELHFLVTFVYDFACFTLHHVMVPNIFAEFDCMFVTFVLEWGHLVCSSTFEHSYSWLGHHSGTLLWYLLWIIWAAYTRVYLVMAESLDVWEYKFKVYWVRGQFNK